MQLDEALLRIVELEETIKASDNTIKGLQEIDKNAKLEIDRLQKSNMALYLKITNKKDEGEPPVNSVAKGEPEPTTTIEDILEKL